MVFQYGCQTWRKLLSVATRRSHVWWAYDSSHWVPHHGFVLGEIYTWSCDVSQCHVTHHMMQTQRSCDASVMSCDTSQDVNLRSCDVHHMLLANVMRHITAQGHVIHHVTWVNIMWHITWYDNLLFLLHAIVAVTSSWWWKSKANLFSRSPFL